MEDALSGNIGSATTQFLKAISFVNKKDKPVEQSGNGKQIKKENPPSVVKPKKTHKKSMLDCDQEGTILFPQEDVIEIESNCNNDSDDTTVNNIGEKTQKGDKQKWIWRT